MHWKETLPDWYIKEFGYYIKEFGYQPSINIGTSGHVDHGKTTLIEAITGIWTSAHSEELRRGITIKVGYADAAFYKCQDCPPPVCYSTQPTCANCGGQSELIRVVSFVDSPGHESLMANMLSGAALMDGSILVVAANEKVPQPQTREHLLALQVLGIQQIVIVQNKVDLTEYEKARDNYEEIKNFVKGSIAEQAPVIPVSAQHKLNIDALIEAIENAIKTPLRTNNAPAIMHVLRSFDINKPGIPIKQVKGGAIGGALVQGEFQIGEEIEIRPGFLEEKKSKYEPINSTIATLGTGAGMVERVRPGGLVAIGTKLDPTFIKSDSLIGSVVGKPNTLPKDVEDITVEVHLFDTAVGTQDMVKVEPVKVKESLRLNIGTAATVGTVTNSKDSKIEIKLKKPVCLIPKSRVAISRRIADRWRLIGAGMAV
ncbi:MAG: translation initiation factor 2 subunit gamma (aeIF-2g) [Nitrososphaeraceae archaeon]|nr:translation initiation factor 2 subunit gamma (aeIF-2g) [Nitrososphaeraceae archaeon]